MSEIVKRLFGHTSFETAYKIEDYPWGFKLRTDQFIWVETVKGKGDRVCRQTVDPRSGKLCKPKKSTYAPFYYLYENEEGHIESAGIYSQYDLTLDKVKAMIETVGADNLTEVQKRNLQVDATNSFIGSSYYDQVKYNTEDLPAYGAWVKNRVEYMMNTPFPACFDIGEAPTQTNPTGEVKYVVTSRSVIDGSGMHDVPLTEDEEADKEAAGL